MADEARVVFDVPGVSCRHCKAAIEAAVGGLDGVSSALVDVEAKRVDVVFDGTRVDGERIAAAIEGEGYAVAGVHAGDG